MEELRLLEEKLVSLAKIVKEKCEKEKSLKAANDDLKLEVEKLKTEVAELVQENSFQGAELSMLKNALQDDSHKLDAFNKEKELTRLVVDDLIKSIDSLVENQS